MESGQVHVDVDNIGRMQDARYRFMTARGWGEAHESHMALMRRNERRERLQVFRDEFSHQEQEGKDGADRDVPFLPAVIKHILLQFSFYKPLKG